MWVVTQWCFYHRQVHHRLLPPITLFRTGRGKTIKPWTNLAARHCTYTGSKLWYYQVAFSVAVLHYALVALFAVLFTLIVYTSVVWTGLVQLSSKLWLNWPADYVPVLIIFQYLMFGVCLVNLCTKYTLIIVYRHYSYDWSDFFLGLECGATIFTKAAPEQNRIKMVTCRLAWSSKHL